MTNYGILVVDNTWRDHDTATLDKATYQHFGVEMTPGSRALVYVKEPVDAIVAEVEIAGEPAEVETTPPDPALHPPPPGSERTEHGIDQINPAGTTTEPTESGQRFGMAYRVPLRLLRSKSTTQPIPLTRIKALLGSGFAVFDDEWIPLNERDYRAVLNELEQRS